MKALVYLFSMGVVLGMVSCQGKGSSNAPVADSLSVDSADLAVEVPETAVVGSWVEPVKVGEQDTIQGICLQADGTASSINMHTLTAKSWAMADGKFVLTSVSEGSGAPTESTDTFEIQKLDADSLVLAKEGMTLKYGKLK